MVADAGAGGLDPRIEVLGAAELAERELAVVDLQLAVAADEPAEATRLRRRREHAAGTSAARRHRASRAPCGSRASASSMDGRCSSTLVAKSSSSYVARSTSHTERDVVGRRLELDERVADPGQRRVERGQRRRGRSGRPPDAASSRSISSSASDTIAQRLGTRRGSCRRRRAGSGPRRGRPRPARAHGWSRLALAASRWPWASANQSAAARRTRRPPAPPRRARRCVSPAARSWRDCGRGVAEAGDRGAGDEHQRRRPRPTTASAARVGRCARAGDEHEARPRPCRRSPTCRAARRGADRSSTLNVMPSDAGEDPRRGAPARAGPQRGGQADGGDGHQQRVEGGGQGDAGGDAGDPPRGAGADERRSARRRRRRAARPSRGDRSAPPDR